MTAIKQVAIASAQHMKSLSGYLDRANGKHDVLDFGSRNLTDPENWSREMDRTREAQRARPQGIEVHLLLSPDHRVQPR